MRRGSWVLLFLALLIPRLAHLRILWIEECYPAAAAIQVLHGKLPYRDFFFDKPPLSAFLYTLWLGYEGWPLRLAGALYALLCCVLIAACAARLWSPREGRYAAALLGFFLTFEIPSAALALAPDLLLIAPHLAAVMMAAAGRPFCAGLLAGVALLVNTKAVFVLAACLFWQWRAAPRLLAGFAVPNLAAAGVLGAYGALGAWWQQVWLWGLAYARDTFVEHPIREGALRLLSWCGFHAALLAGAFLYFRRRAEPHRLRLLGWVLLSLAGVAGGLRFFPRYWFLLLPVAVLAAARGLAITPARFRAALLYLLLIPLFRFGPRYATLATDLVQGRRHDWSDIALNEDSARASAEILHRARPGDSVLVCGYRPDILVYTRLSLGTPFLDSQPLTGVLADRHLRGARLTFPGIAAGNRHALTAYRPAFIVDGLGPYNNSLAITRYPELASWLAGYQEIARTNGSVVYGRRPSVTGPPSTARASPETRPYPPARRPPGHS